MTDDMEYVLEIRHAVKLGDISRDKLVDVAEEILRRLNELAPGNVISQAYVTGRDVVTKELKIVVSQKQFRVLLAQREETNFET